VGEITENTSDGYHTFKELYAHRIALFIALAKSHADISWKAIKHDDGSSLEGWFIAGMHLPTGDISYHLPDNEWDRLDVEALTNAPKWDGHTSDDVVQRINEWVECMNSPTKANKKGTA
jgi:hypothetical protein